MSSRGEGEYAGKLKYTYTQINEKINKRYTFIYIISYEYVSEWVMCKCMRYMYALEIERERERNGERERGGRERE